MRQARFLPPDWRRLSRIAGLLGLILTAWGCQQPPIYFHGYSAPPCVPVVPAPAARVTGKAGEPATDVVEGGMTTVNAPGRTTTVIGSEAPPRVVVSEPEYQRAARGGAIPVPIPTRPSPPASMAA